MKALPLYLVDAFTDVAFWAARLGKTKMTARQLSARGGDLRLELAGDRVKIAGRTRLYSKGEAFIPA